MYILDTETIKRIYERSKTSWICENPGIWRISGIIKHYLSVSYIHVI